MAKSMLKAWEPILESPTKAWETIFCTLSTVSRYKWANGTFNGHVENSNKGMDVQKQPCLYKAFLCLYLAGLVSQLCNAG